MDSLNTVFNVGSVLAVIASVIAIIITTRRRAGMTDAQSDADLESTVVTLQNLLYEKQRQIDALQIEYNATLQRLALLEAQTSAAKPPRRQSILLAVIGDDPALSLDLAALREVERRGTFRLSRLRPATKSKLKETLDQHRAEGNPIRHVHMAVHAGPEGILLNGELVTASWLSENLKSVDVLLLGGCQSTGIANAIGIVPNVVTMREDVSHTDAAQFAKLFWSGISDGLDVDVAFDAAVERSPQGLSEFVELRL